MLHTHYEAPGIQEPTDINCLTHSLHNYQSCKTLTLHRMQTNSANYVTLKIAAEVCTIQCRLKPFADCYGSNATYLNNHNPVATHTHTHTDSSQYKFSKLEWIYYVRYKKSGSIEYCMRKKKDEMAEKRSDKVVTDTHN